MFCTDENEQVLKIRNDSSPRLLLYADKDGKAVLSTKEEPDKELEPKGLRQEIEPWLTALFQSEHLGLLTGSGLSTAVHILATGSPGAGMSRVDFSVFKEQIDVWAEESAKAAGRGTKNIEDQIRTANELLQGLKIYASDKVEFFGVERNRYAVAG